MHKSGVQAERAAEAVSGCTSAVLPTPCPCPVTAAHSVGKRAEGTAGSARDPPPFSSSATSAEGKPGRQGTWKPPHNERNGSGMLQMQESFHSERDKSGSAWFQETELGRLGRTGRERHRSSINRRLQRISSKRNRLPTEGEFRHEPCSTQDE